MNRERALKVADAVLYEGYMLYPYRRSAMKNRQRWSFGILYPPGYHEVGVGTERSQMHSEVLLRVTDPEPALQVQLRFLQLLEQESGDEGEARSVAFDRTLGAFQVPTQAFSFPLAKSELRGTVVIAVDAISANVVKLAIDVTNTSDLQGDAQDRNSALLSSLLSAHTILSITGGEFISLLEPPDELRQAASECKNVGNFPVLVGDEDERDMMLCSPIVLYDYPQIAPESAGDFFDGTEMDEMLTLRVMTMTNEEKNEVRNSGDLVRDLLQRTEANARGQLMRTHGTIRSMRQVNEP
jgi:hypothetical protein